MKESKKKHSVWLSESAWANVEHHYQADNCSTKNEYIEKAIQFYSGYLDTEHAEEYLPRILSDVLEGKLGAFGKRMGHLIFKQAVDQDLMANLLASDINVVTITRNVDTHRFLPSNIKIFYCQRHAVAISAEHHSC